MEPSPEAWPLSLTIETMQFGPEGLTVRQLRDAVRAAGVRPVGRMKWGAGRRHVPLYPAADLIRVCEALSDDAERPPIE